MDRFWSKVEKRGDSECWNWKGARADNGYGHLIYEGKTVSAHRFVYFLTHGAWPIVAMHLCDNRACCNPAHVLGGTRQENIDDMWKKGRGSCNQRHPNCIYSDDMVAELRRRFADGGISKRQLAKEMGMSYTHAVSILNRKRRPEYVPAVEEP